MVAYFDGPEAACYDPQDSKRTAKIYRRDWRTPTTKKPRSTMGRESSSETRSGEKRQGVTIELTDAQVERVFSGAAHGAGRVGVLASVADLQDLQSALLPLLDDDRCSRAVLRALLVLAAFPPDGSEREFRHVASDLSLSPSTAHRYIRTWLMVGLLGQDPTSRRYRRSNPSDRGHVDAG